MECRFACFEDEKRVQEVIKTMEDAVAGADIPQERLVQAQEFLLKWLEEINSQRPALPIRCGGNVISV